MGKRHGRLAWWLAAAVGATLGAGACTSMLDLDGYDYQPAQGGSGNGAGALGGGQLGGGTGGSGGTAPTRCTDGSQNGDETDTDCGGSCPACANGKGCNGPGDCQSGLCSGGTCSACTSGGQCGDGAYCEGGVCQPKKPNGETCGDGFECQSGHCPGQDGVCCNASCIGTCRACLKSKTGIVDGVCSNITLGTDPDGECTTDIACNGIGACIGCGYLQTPPGGSCPPACTGGCTQTTCTIDCTESDACNDTTLSCPPGFHCQVYCGAYACTNVTVNCLGEPYTCQVNCAQTGACSGMTVQCGVGPCDLTCNGSLSCSGATVNCSVNACSASCEINALKPNMSCGNACSCNGCN